MSLLNFIFFSRDDWNEQTSFIAIVFQILKYAFNKIPFVLLNYHFMNNVQIITFLTIFFFKYSSFDSITSF